MLVSLLFIVGKSVLTTKVLTDLLIFTDKLFNCLFSVKKFLSVIFLLFCWQDIPMLLLEFLSSTKNDSFVSKNNDQIIIR
ncbi:hypothetical protein RU91_GL000449 [Lactococcus lactis subsp. lactis]|nr:hypothetical protein RU91_GL000449 [Lactococcus lactis subsp. lactis]